MRASPRDRDLWDFAGRGLDAEEAAADAIAKAEAGAARAWLDAARAAILRLGGEMADFTTDDIWPLVPPTREPRAMGAVIRRLSEDGLIEPCGFRKSNSRVNHRRPVTVWRLTQQKDRNMIGEHGENQAT